MLVWVEKRAIMEAVRKEKDHGNNHPGTGRRNRHARQCSKTYQGRQGENSPSDSNLLEINRTIRILRKNYSP